MEVIIRGKDIKITDSVDEYAQETVGKLNRYLPNIREVRVDLSRKHTRRGEGLTIAQITLRHERGAILRSEEKVQSNDHDSVKVAIGTAVDKMYRQIERFKGKRKDKKRRSSKSWDVYAATEEEISEAEEVPMYEQIAAEYDDFDEIVRRKEVEMAPMSEDEAISQMELLAHPFYMFKNSATNAVNVVYRRSDGGYGILIPE